MTEGGLRTAGCPPVPVRNRVIATRVLPGPAFAELGDVELIDVDRVRGAGRALDGAAVLLVAGDQVGDELLDLLPDLELVGQYGVGFNNIDTQACARRGVRVATTPGVLDASVAELTLALILSLQRRLLECDGFVRSGRWARSPGESEALIGEDVQGATLGIVGLGRIGRAVAQRARAFGMRVLYTQRHRLAPSEEEARGVEYRSLDALAAEVDFLTLHCPLTSDTTSLLDARRLAALPDGAAVINTSRGPVVDEEALVAELVMGRLRAGLDVFTAEPHVPPQLLGLPNVVLAPHVGSLTRGTRAAMTRLLVENVQALRAGRRLPTALDLGGS